MHYHSANNIKNCTLVVQYFLIEVGGKNKGLKQIVNSEKGYVVKDNIETGFLNTIPLCHFGLMY